MGFGSIADVPDFDRDSRGIWLYSNADIDIIGLYDPEHTAQDGYYFSSVGYPFLYCSRRWDSLNEAGHVIGANQRFDASGNDLGVSSCLYRDGDTRTIGLIDNDHTRSTDGYRSSRSVQLNNVGQVMGCLPVLTVL